MTGFSFLVFVTVPHFLHVRISVYALLPDLLNSLQPPLQGAWKDGPPVDGAAGCSSTGTGVSLSGCSLRVTSMGSEFGICHDVVFVDPREEIGKVLGRTLFSLSP